MMYFEAYEDWSYTISWYPTSQSVLLQVFNENDELEHTNIVTDPINARAQARTFINSMNLFTANYELPNDHDALS